MLRRLTIALALGIATVLTAAATAAPVGQPYEVTTADGVTLRGWVHFPEGPAPYATILEFTPYIDNNGDDSSADLGGFDYLLNAGYALARVSVRGTGRSVIATGVSPP